MNKIILGLALFLGAFVQPAFAQKVELSAKFNQSLKSYYALKNALATDKALEASQLANTLQLAVKEVPHQGFANEKMHQLWMKESGIIIQQAAELAKSKDLKSQRKNFEGISAAFIKLSTELKLNNQEVFVQYCPMGKFSWLNEVKQIQNPYYGSHMYDCGTVKDTLPKN